MAGFDKNNRDPEVEALIDQYPEEKDIYRYMRSEFDKVDETYDAEIHDEKVCGWASEKFGITSEEAGDLYTRMEFRIHEFQMQRLKESK